MGIPKEYQYNSAAKYAEGAVYNYTAIERSNIRQFLINPTIYVNQSAGFDKKFLDIAYKYVLPIITHDADVQRWTTNPMVFWQNQLNFAVWCASTGCGVSVRDHLTAQANPMIMSFYRFHVYFQVRKILNHMRCPLPSYPTWNPFNNAIDMTTYELLCNEFGVDKDTDWRQKHDKNSGLGSVYLYYGSGYHVLLDGNYYPQGSTRAIRQSFTETTTNDVLHIDYIQQGSDVTDGWVYSMLDKSQGFTEVGVRRINDSIRAYVWAILGAQSSMRTSIVGTGTAFDAQDDFLAKIQARIDHEVDPPTSVATYQDVLHYARSKLDFALGSSLYMAPSDMELKIGQIENYNNEIVIAKDDMTLGTNQQLNRTKRVVIVPEAPPRTVPAPPPPRTVPAPPRTAPNDDVHESTKTVLLVGAVGLSLVIMMLR